jgi:hypothetical protein
MNELINLGNGQFVKVTMLKGERGTNIATITKTGTSGLVDTYTVTLTDGHTTTFEVTNGSSIASIEKTSTVGTVDTYTITLTNGETSTFTVTNATGIIDSNFSETSTNAIQTSTVTNVISGVENGANASRTYNVGEYILRNNLMYKVIALTASGEAWNVGLNLEATGIGAELTQLNNDLTKKALVNTYYNSSTKKLYEVNADGTQGAEIKTSVLPDVSNVFHTINIGAGLNVSYTTDRDCFIIGEFASGGNSTGTLTVGGSVIYSGKDMHFNAGVSLFVPSGTLVTYTGYLQGQGIRFCTPL